MIATAIALTVTAVAAGAALGLPNSADGRGSRAAATASPTTHLPGSKSSPNTNATTLGRAFLADWVEGGRVVRRDQGSDTVSEGQAYGMLIALSLKDERASTRSGGGPRRTCKSATVSLPGGGRTARWSTAHRRVMPTSMLPVPS